MYLARRVLTVPERYRNMRPVTTNYLDGATRMQLTIDTTGATQFELTALAELLQKLAGTGPLVYQGTVRGESQSVDTGTLQNLPKQNSHPDDSLGNDAPTVIPSAPASATGSESPPNVPAAPSATPADSASAVPAAPSAVKLDSAGFPWDARINTANKGTVGDGTWRKKPGVDPALIESVRAELSAGAAPRTDAPAVPAAPAIDPNAAATGVIPVAPAPETAAPVAPTLTAQDVLARCTEIQMADMAKGAALFQAIVGAGVAGGPMALPSVTDPAILAACLKAVTAVGAA
jgi:hypothetical protein